MAKDIKDVTMTEVAASMEIIKESVAKIREEADANGALSETVKNMKEALDPIVEAHTKMVDSFEASQKQTVADTKRIDLLETTISKLPTAKKGDAEMDVEFVAKFIGVLEKTSDKNIDGAFYEETATKLFEHYSQGLSEDRKLKLKAALVGSSPDGGYYAPIDVSNQINKRIFETSDLRSVANVVTTAGEARSSIIDDQENDAGWVGEVSNRPSTDTAQVGLKEITIHEMYAMPKASQKVLDDALFNVAGWLTQKTSDKFVRLENNAFINGDGVQKPEGILSLGDWASVESYLRGSLGTRSTAASLTIAADDLIKMQGDLFEGYQARATWAFHRRIWTDKIVTLKDENNNYLLNFQMMFQGATFALLGKPVKLMGDLPSTISASAYVALYADFMEGYTIVDRIGIRVLRDPYTNKPFILFYTTKRVGGGVTNYQAIKRLKITA